MRIRINQIVCACLLGVTLAGCGGSFPENTLAATEAAFSASPVQVETEFQAPVTTGTALPTLPLATLAPALTASQTATGTAVPSKTPTAAPTETATLSPPTNTPVPTYVNLRGKVIPEKANCRYGPGAPYLYKYLLIGGSNLEIIGRNDLGTWIQIRAIGGNNPCWVKADLMEIKGDVLTVAPVHPDDAGLPWSPYYGPLKGVSARRDGTQVTVSWSPLALRAGDDSEQFPYLLEAWVCQGGQLVFTPLGSYETAVAVEDQPGCAEPSHGRVYGVEKHGYTQWVEVSWPQP